MSPEWSPEISVSAEQCRALIEAQFPTLAPVLAEPLGEGWDNTAYRVNGVYVFRFPRRQIAVRCLELEARALATLAPRLPLPVPIPEFIGVPSEAFPWPFVGHRMIPGRPASDARLGTSQRAALAEPLAHFLRALHAIPVEEAARLGAGPDPFQRLDLAPRLARARDILDELARRRLVDDARPLWSALQAAPALYAPRADTLVHGDLYARQLLVDGEGRLSGVIDWGDLHVGNPAVDFAVAHSFLPPEAHTVFRRAYGEIADATWALARARAVWHTLNVTLYADSVADACLLRECGVALGLLGAGTEQGEGERSQL